LRVAMKCFQVALLIVRGIQFVLNLVRIPIFNALPVIATVIAKLPPQPLQQQRHLQRQLQLRLPLRQLLKHYHALSSVMMI